MSAVVASAVLSGVGAISTNASGNVVGDTIVGIFNDKFRPAKNDRAAKRAISDALDVFEKHVDILSHKDRRTLREKFRLFDKRLMAFNASKGIMRIPKSLALRGAGEEAHELAYTMSDGVRQSRLFRKISVESLQERGRIVVSDPFRDQLPSIRAQAVNTDCPHTDTRDGAIHLPSEVGSAKHITWALDSEVSDIPLAELDISEHATET